MHLSLGDLRRDSFLMHTLNAVAEHFAVTVSFGAHFLALYCQAEWLRVLQLEVLELQWS